MTGYGTGEARLGAGTVVVDVRAVNHRFLDVRVRAASELGDQAAAAEEIVRGRLSRGRVEVGLRLSSAAGGPSLDRERARSAFAELAALRDELRPDEPVPLALLAAVPDLFASGVPSDPEATRTAVAAATVEACDALDAMREREGASLARDLSQRLALFRGRLELVRGRAPEVVDALARKLRERIERLLRDVDVELDPGRLEHEVALLADRLDVSEELTRLDSHCEQMAELLGTDGPVGRKIEFLLQELSRETNTLGAKCPDVEVTRAVVDMKAELERLREQVANIL
jgi:uncharacterized protein (TIGR00255 family)